MPGTTKEIQGVIPWNGKGNYTQNADVTLAGKTGSGSVTSTYTVDSKGRFSCQYIRVRCRSAARPSSTASSASGGDLKNLAQPQAFAAGYGHSTDKTGWSISSTPSVVISGPLHPSRGHSNHRLVSFTNGQVSFRWRDSPHQNEQKLPHTPPISWHESLGIATVKQPILQVDLARIIAGGIAAGQTENPPNHYAAGWQALLQKTYARAQIRR
jgi:hypothetical protein